jgi:hypothetical protein
MVDTANNSRDRHFLWFCIAALAVIATRVPGLIMGTPDSLLNDSELEMTFAALDRFLGVPSAVLIWPAGLLHILAVPLFLGDFIFSPHCSASPAAFVAYLSEMYRQPWHALLLIRLTVVLTSSLSLAALHQPFSAILENRFSGLLAVIGLSTVPIFWSHSHAGVPDSVAFGLAAASLAPLLVRPVNDRRIAMSGLLAGLAVASKVTVIPLLPFVIAVALQHCVGSKWRSLLKLSLFLGVGFAVGCPYLWTDPVRFAKTVLGNAARNGMPMGFGNALLTTLDVLPVWFCTMLIAGFVLLAIKRQGWLFAGAIASSALTIKIVAGAGVTFPRYLLPLAPIAAVMTVFVLAEMRGWLSRHPAPKYFSYATAAVLSLIIVGNTFIYSRRLPMEFEEFRAFQEAAADLKKLDRSSVVIVPFDNFFYYMADRASSRSLRLLGDRCAQIMIEGRAVSRFAARSGFLSESAVASLPRVFDAQEQDFVAQIALMSSNLEREGFDLRVWIVDDLAPRFGFLTREEAMDLFVQGKVDAVIVNRKAENQVPTRTYGNRWFLYVRESS